MAKHAKHARPDQDVNWDEETDPEADPAAEGPTAEADPAVEPAVEAAPAPEADPDPAIRKRINKWRIVTIVSAVVLVCALVALAVMGFSYLQGQHKYENVRDQAAVNTEDPSNLASMSADWDALRAVNPDVVGWIYVPNSPIDYPIVQGEDNEYYLNHAFDRSENWLAAYGTIFMDYTNNPQFMDSNTFLYGHHMADGSMFAFLDTLAHQENFDTNRDIYILTPQGNFWLRTFAMVLTDGSDFLVQPNFGSAEEMDAYITDKLERSCVSVTDDVVDQALRTTKIFGMSTCDYSRSDGRAILFSLLVESTVPGVEGVGR
ncbi:MAG: class B sortase [Coriobacteriia bacterium]|nr:class B sortase [Coriobacteriia bacterium]